jgi:hypothetical protein
MEKRIEQLEEIIKSQSKAFSREMFTNIRRAMGQLQTAQKESSVDLGEVTSQIKQLIGTKAETEIVNRL